MVAHSAAERSPWAFGPTRSLCFIGCRLCIEPSLAGAGGRKDRCAALALIACPPVSHPVGYERPRPLAYRATARTGGSTMVYRMPLYMDRHDLPGVTPADLAVAHALDVDVQDKHGVRYLSYWFDYERQTGFCLVESPSREAAEAVHRESHGMVANSIIEVDPQRVSEFLGHPPVADVGRPYVATAFRTVLFTDIHASTALTQRLGDIDAMRVLRRHDEVVRDALRTSGGLEVKHTGDGIMASFTSVARAVECSIRIQQRIAGHIAEQPDEAFRVKIGLAAGEPVTEGDDLFGAAVQLAARLCDQAGADGILVSAAVRDLCIGKTFGFLEHGELTLRGFEEPVRAYTVHWNNDLLRGAPPAAT
jgi:class 3 adenylate cyclase